MIKSAIIAVEPRPVSNPSVKIADIEFLRGLAIVFTLVAHSILVFPNSAGLLALMSSHWFGSGVDLFFVISSFVITASLRSQILPIWDEVLPMPGHRKEDANGNRDRRRLVVRVLAAFWIRRAFRLLPGAFATIALTMVFIAFYTPKAVGGVLGGFWVHALAGVAALLQVFNFYGWRQTVSGDPVTLFGAYWSLSLEEQFYLFYPFILVACGSMRRVGLVASLIVISMFFVRKNLPYDAMWWFRVDGLFWGVAIACFRPSIGPSIRLGRHTKMVTTAVAVVLCSVGLTETTIRMYAYDSANGVTLIFAAMLVILASWNQDLFQFRLIGPLFVFLGERSYAIYLLHILVFAMAQLTNAAALKAGLPSTLAAMATGLFILVSILPIDLFHKYIEVRYRELGRQISAQILSRPLPVRGTGVPVTR